MRNPFRRPRPDVAAAQEIAADLDTFEVPLDDDERRRLMTLYQLDPSPMAGYRFWKLAAPDIRAGFLAARRGSGA